MYWKRKEQLFRITSLTRELNYNSGNFQCLTTQLPSMKLLFITVKTLQYKFIPRNKKKESNLFRKVNPITTLQCSPQGPLLAPLLHTWLPSEWHLLPIR